jgi:hypothetical protein
VDASGQYYVSTVLFPRKKSPFPTTTALSRFRGAGSIARISYSTARISLLVVYSVRQKHNGPGIYVVPESAKLRNVCRSLHTGRAQPLFSYHEITAHVICTYVTRKVDTMFYECKKRDRPTVSRHLFYIDIQTDRPTKDTYSLHNPVAILRHRTNVILYIITNHPTTHSP